MLARRREPGWTMGTIWEPRLALGSTESQSVALSSCATPICVARDLHPESLRWKRSVLH
jgi:hypothetical protein